MNEENYDFSKVEEKLRFEFESVSEQLVVRKVIEYQLINEGLELYNLAFVDILEDDSLSDLSVTNNRDMPKVLATVYRSMLIFFERKPTARIYIKGSTPSRTRLYQIAISKYLEEFQEKFRILGFLGTDVLPFEKGTNYDSFIVVKI